MLSDSEREEINPEFCCRHLLNISSRLRDVLNYEEMSAIWGAISLIKNQSVDEWCFGIKQEEHKD